MESSLMGTEGSDRALESGSKVDSLVVFPLGCPGSRVDSAEGRSLRDYSSFQSYG